MKNHDLKPQSPVLTHPLATPSASACCACGSLEVRKPTLPSERDKEERELTWAHRVFFFAVVKKCLDVEFVIYLLFFPCFLLCSILFYCRLHVASFLKVLYECQICINVLLLMYPEVLRRVQISTPPSKMKVKTLWSIKLMIPICWNGFNMFQQVYASEDNVMESFHVKVILDRSAESCKEKRISNLVEL